MEVAMEKLIAWAFGILLTLFAVTKAIEGVMWTLKAAVGFAKDVAILGVPLAAAAVVGLIAFIGRFYGPNGVKDLPTATPEPGFRRMSISKIRVRTNPNGLCLKTGKTVRACGCEKHNGVGQ
jgi:hypothetical protein